jgi:hypothetical protein
MNRTGVPRRIHLLGMRIEVSSTKEAPSDLQKEAPSDLQIEEVEADATVPPEILTVAIREEFRYHTVVLIGALIIVVLGVILLLMGVTGSINWHLTVPGVDSSLTNAAPGAVAIVLGGVVIILKGPKVTIHRQPK